MSDELEDTYAAQIESAMRAGWNDPLMDAYNDYDNARNPILNAWSLLLNIRVLTFHSRSNSNVNTGWSGQGNGTVNVVQPDSQTVIYNESGTWSPETGKPTSFSNVYRWTLIADENRIRLEHLRFGPSQPVYLFDLVSTGRGMLVSAERHVCREDIYSATMEYAESSIRLAWSITGPKMDERVEYSYR